MISITPVLSSELAPFVFQEGIKSSFGSLASRVSRVATLDGGSALINSGVTEGDRTITLEGVISETQGAAVEALRAENPVVHMSSDRGFYYGAILELNVDNGLLSMTFLVNLKLK